MSKENYFLTEDGTEGTYTQDQMDTINDRFSDWFDNAGIDSEDSDHCKSAMERIISNFDTEIAPKNISDLEPGDYATDCAGNIAIVKLDESGRKFYANCDMEDAIMDCEFKGIGLEVTAVNDFYDDHLSD